MRDVGNRIRDDGDIPSGNVFEGESRDDAMNGMYGDIESVFVLTHRGKGP